MVKELVIEVVEIQDIEEMANKIMVYQMEKIMDLMLDMWVKQTKLCPREMCGSAWMPEGGCGPARCEFVRNCWQEWFVCEGINDISIWRTQKVG